MYSFEDAKDENNRAIISELVEKHFGLSESSIEKFKEALNNPDIDPTYKEHLGNDLRARVEIPTEYNEYFDRGWEKFKQTFSHLISEFGLTYENFRENRVLFEKNTLKLYKFLRKYFLSDEDGYDKLGWNFDLPRPKISVAERLWERRKGSEMYGAYYTSTDGDTSYASNTSDTNWMYVTGINGTLEAVPVSEEEIVRRKEEKEKSEAEEKKKAKEAEKNKLKEIEAIHKEYVDNWKRELENAFEYEMKDIMNVKLPVNKKLYVVVSLNFADWFLCSTAEDWRSCLSHESDFFGCYWAGLPGLVTDENRAMLYITDGETKNYKGIEVEKVLSRTWLLLDNEGTPNTIRWFPHKLVPRTVINRLFPLKLKGLVYRKDTFRSKYGVELLEYEDGKTCFIYQDNTTFYGADNIFVARNGGGHVWFDGIDCREEGPIFNYRGGLTSIISKGTKITEVSKFLVCCNCGDELRDNDALYHNDRAYCENCYHDIFSECVYCCSVRHSRNINYVDTIGPVCNECYSEHIEECECCGREVEADNICVHEETSYCPSCYRDVQASA